MATDMLGRALTVDDYVVFYNNIYKVVEVDGDKLDKHGYAKIILMDKSKTTKTVRKYTREMFLIHKEDLVVMKLKRGY